ncbi:MAG: Tat pathway signal sequence domain protein [Bryobacteraceae bacterium]
MKMTRRNALGVLASTVSAAAFEQEAATQTAPHESVAVGWLGGNPPPIDSGVSWGVPWPRGAVRKDQSFTLTTAEGKALPLQSWPMAYWPDGSLKWTGFATVAGPSASGAFQLAQGTAAAPAFTVKVTESGAAIDIDTGRIQCRIPRQGALFIESITMEGRAVARQGRLVSTLEDRSDLDRNRAVRFEDFTSSIRKVTVEQTGPVRAVVRIEGVHKAGPSGRPGAREWLPFTVRLYFYAGLEQVRLVHTIVFDGDDQKDFIRGLGVAFSVPMREQVHNRHVRFSGEGDGLWAEPVQPASARPLMLPGGRGNAYPDQLAGKRIPNKEAFDQRGQKLLADWAVWDAYKLVQPTADGFTIRKRTNPQSCWLDAAAGGRASGLVFAGDVSGGLAVGVKNFWQSYPASLEVQKAAGEAADLFVWLWSPDAAAMDLRHYDTKAHGLDSSYEDVQPGFSTAHGVARTSEMTLYPSASVPAREDAARQAKAAQEPPLLVATPQHLHAARVFGIWGLPDRSTPAKQRLEDQLDAAFAVYHKEVEQRHWYGFWDYGDVMHQHDALRHMWRYDVGGYAWDNTELGTDMWLWSSFLRSGRADIFRMAEAMTRHTTEVDTYHLGRFAPLGSRHNVRHWGCGAKEPRISQAAFRRYYYYLTTDERTGDVMREVVDADYKTAEIDPMRLASPLTKPIPYPGRVRGGPDWLAFIGNWMTEWERTGNPKYRDKIIAGMDSITKMPYWFMTGPNNLWGYEPATSKLYPLVEDGFGTYNLTTIQGGAEVVFELNSLIDHAGWKKAWNQYCRLHGAPKDVVAKDMTTGSEGADGQYARGRLAAYAYMETRNPAFAKRASSGLRLARFATTSVKGPAVLNPLEEVPGLSTNGTAQGCLEAIEVLEMCGDQM